ARSGAEHQLRAGQPRPEPLLLLDQERQGDLDDLRPAAVLLMDTHVILGANLALIPSFTVIGIVLGGVYALAAVGLVLIFRVSGVLNFAHGAVAMFATFVAYQISVVNGAPGWAGLLVAIAAGAVVGLLVEVLTMRPLAGKPALTKVVVTIGWLLVLQTLA